MTAHGYHLLDTGHGRKLEQFGPVIVDRPAPQAVWHPALNKGEWQSAQLYYVRENHGGGHWQPGANTKQAPDEWQISYYDLEFFIKPTPFGHMGLFCEQAVNWGLLSELCRATGNINVLNLFAYTGASTLFARHGGASLTHVDSSKSIVAWARRNAELNKLDGIRWLVEDVRKYVSREARREAQYQGLILDPPTFGRGPKGQVWKIEDNLLPMMDELISLLKDPKFVFLSCHSPNFSPIGLATLLSRYNKLTGGSFILSEMLVGQTLPGAGASNQVMPNGFHCSWVHNDLMGVIESKLDLTLGPGGFYFLAQTKGH